MPTTTDLELENFGSLITIKGTDNCLGDLMAFDGKGIYCPSHGEVSRFGVTKEHADAHNQALDEARLKGLDDNCQIGQGGFFYLKKDKRAGVHGDWLVTTFIGTIVAENASVRKTNKFQAKLGTYRHTVVFTRKGKTFKGSWNGYDCCFNFKRTK
jgi:hypothetical protein